MLCRTVLTCIFLPAMASAEPDESISKFKVDGETLIYDTEAAKNPDDREVQNRDVDDLLAVLRSNDAIAVLKLNSTGGSVWAGQEIARVVVDYELDTLVEGECSSSCTIIFLAGATRKLARGGKLGFHQRSWEPASIKAYYDSWREDEGWDTPYDFASWVYKDTQTEIYKEMLYMISRGVDPAFAIETKSLRSTTWFPSRAELMAAGVLVD